MRRIEMMSAADLRRVLWALGILAAGVLAFFGIALWATTRGVV